MKVEELLTVKEAAQSLRLGRSAVQRLIRSKRLPAKKVGPAYVIARQDVEGLKHNGGRHQEVREELDEVYEECRSSDWDGYGAKAVSRRCYREAVRFCGLLPASVPAPEAGADPDGEIAFEWQAGRLSAFSVSVGPGRLLTYAGIFGKNRVYGVECFGEEFPEVILENLHRLG